MTDLMYQGLLLDMSGHIKLNLQNGEAVIYSPYGSGKAFVLSNAALYVYEQLAKGLTLQEILQSRDDTDWEESLRAITQFLLEEGLFCTKVPKQVKAKSKRVKSVALWIHVTDACNLRCEYCYVHKGKRSLTRKACDAIVTALRNDVETRQVREVELKFAGGEPLIDTEIIAYLVDQTKSELEPLGIKVRLAIITNGTLVTETKARFLKEKGFSVMVSLDGLGSFNDARKYADSRPSVEHVLQGIEALMLAGIKPTILTTISDKNVEGLWELMQYVRGKGLTLSLSLSRDYEHGVGLTMNVDHVTSSMVAFLEQVSLLPDNELPRLRFNGTQFDGSRTRICGGGSNYFAVDPEANICFCQMTVDKPLGRASDKGGILPFATHIETLGRDGACGKCLWRYVCCGGCAVLALSANTLGEPSVMCELMKDVLPAILVYEGRKIRRKEVKQTCLP